MEVSRLFFSKETKEKMNEPISHFKRGELRWKKIKEYEDKGTLSKAKTRLDIVEMLGSERKYNSVYNWVSSLITRGFLKETLTGFDDNGKMTYEYHTIGKPTFSPTNNFNNQHKKDKNMTKTKATKTITKTAPTITDSNTNKTTVTIRYGELVIEISQVDKDIIESIIAKLADK